VSAPKLEHPEKLNSVSFLCANIYPWRQKGNTISFPKITFSSGVAFPIRNLVFLFKVRVGDNAAERIPCANRTAVLEISITIRSYPETREEHVVEPSTGMTFDSLGEVYDIYNLYSWEPGFGVRYGKSRLNPERTKTM
jgi:hypothetical protein